jgi:hypothetical protein
VGPVAARDEHDGGGRPGEAQLRRHLEAAHVGQLHVQQDDLGQEAQRLGETGGAVLGAADYREPLRLEHLPGHGAEGGVVVDDQDCPAHARIVAPRAGPRMP